MRRMSASQCTAYYPVQCFAKWCNATEQQVCARQDLLHSCSNNMPVDPCWAALHQLGSIALAPSWCNTPLSGVTPLRNKRECGQLLVRSGLCGLMDVRVVVPGGNFRQTADPFIKIPRNPAVFAQWVCTLAEWLACRCAAPGLVVVSHSA